MSYQYVAIDLDGTLLDKDKCISSGNIYEINRLQSKGVEVMVVSGRHYSEIKILLEKYDIFNIHLIVSRDGQYIHLDGEVIYEAEMLSMKHLNEIMNIAKVNQLFCSSIHRDYMVYSSCVRYVKDFIKRKNDNICRIPLFLAKILNLRIGKVILYKGQLTKAFTCEKMQNYFTVHFVNNNEYDILPLGVNKYTALSWLEKHRNIKLNNLLYIGDDYNDIENFMNLSACVVMGNAPKELQKFSILKHTKNNNEDGVADALKRLFF